MSNEVEIIVRARDQSGAGIDEAKARLKGLAEAAKRVPSDVKIKATVDDAKAEANIVRLEAEIARLEERWARGDVAKFKVEADTTAAEEKLEKLRLDATRATGEKKVTVKAETAEAEAKLAALRAKKIRIDMDTAMATAKIELLQHELANVGKSGESSLDRLQKKLNDVSTKGFSPLITAALALGPALLPVAAQAVTIVGSLGNSLAGAGAAAGVFGAVVKSTFSEVKEASDKTDGLREKIRLLGREAQLAGVNSALGDKVLKAREKAILELRARMSLLPPATRAVVTSFQDMKSAWEDFKDTNKGEAFSFLTRAFDLARRIIPQLQPLFDAGAQAANKLMTVFERKVQDGGVERLIKYLANNAKGALSDTIGIFTNLARALGNFLKATNDGGGALHWVEQMTQKLADFTKSQSFMDFLDWVRSNGPQVGEALIHIAQAAVKIATATAPLAPISLAVANALAALIAAIPLPMLTGIVAAFIAWSVAMKALTVTDKINDFRVKLSKLGGEAEGTAGKLGKVNAVAGKMGAAFGIVALAELSVQLSGVAGSSSVADVKVGDLAKSLLALQQTGKASGAILDLLNVSSSRLYGPVNNAADALNRFGEEAQGAFSMSWDNIIGRAQSGDERMQRFNKTAGEMDGALGQLVASGHADAAVALFNQLEAATGLTGDELQHVTNRFPQYRAALAAAGLQADGTAGKTKTLAQQLAAVRDAAYKAAAGLLANRAGARALEQAFEDATNAIKTNGRTLDIHTQKGRDNQAALDGVAQAARDDAEATVKSTGSHRVANQVLAAAAARLQVLYEKAGMSTGAAHELAQQLLGIPKETNPQLAVRGAKAAAAAAQAVANALAGIRGKSVTVAVNYRTTGDPNAVATTRGRSTAFAHGGVVGHAAEGGPRSNQTLVGEHGPELVDLAPGSTVHSNPDSERMSANGGQQRVVLEIKSGGSAMDDLLVQILRKAIRTRGGNVQLALGQ